MNFLLLVGGKCQIDIENEQKSDCCIVQWVLQDIITTQEEFAKVTSEFSKFRNQTSSELHALRVTLFILSKNVQTDETFAVTSLCFHGMDRFS